MSCSLKDYRDDRYFTVQTVSNELVRDFFDIIDVKYIKCFVEPSVGEGSFVNAILNNCKIPIIAIDIYPYNSTNNAVQSYVGDFLSCNLQGGNSIAVIGNPPFGKNASMAVKFFNHAATFADVIAFVVPRTFRKTCIINRLNDEFHPVQEKIIRENSFEYNGKIVDVPCIWKVWVKRDFKPRHPKWEFEYNTLRPRIQNGPMKTNLVSFVKDPESATLMVQRVGVAAGRAIVDRNEMMKKRNSTNFYFISINRELCSPEKLYKFSMENFDGKYDTAGMPSITKSDVVQEIHSYLDIPIN